MNTIARKLIKRLFLGILILGCTAGSSSAAVIFTDNFNIADTSSLDGSDQTARHSGLLSSAVVLRSGGIQMTITDQRLDFLRPALAPGRIRFQDASQLPSDVLWNFASGPAGAQILLDRGFRFSFDWTPIDNTDIDWLSLSVGGSGLDQKFRVNDAETDFGILFRNNGGTQLFDNAAFADGPNYNVATVRTHHAQVDFSFNSFADGSLVSATTSIDGVALGGSTTFQWDNNFGVLNMELGNFASGTTLDNVSITTLPEPGAFSLLGLSALAVAAGWRYRRPATFFGPG